MAPAQPGTPKPLLSKLPDDIGVDGAARAAEPAITALVEEEPVVDERWMPATELLHGCSANVPQSCAEMLRLALPLALGTLKEERHSFQNAIIGVLSSLHAKEESMRRETLEAVESALMKLVSDKDVALAQIEAMEAELDVRTKEKDSRGAAVQEHIAAVEAATMKLDSEQSKVLHAQEQAAAHRQRQMEFEDRVSGVWEQLLANGFDKTDWMLRNKAMEGVLDCLQLADVEPSLLAALPVVLKRGEAPEERNEFAVLAIKRADFVLKNHLVRLASQIEDLEEEAASQLEAAGTAEVELQEANATLDEVSRTNMEAHNLWINLDAKVRDMQSAIDEYPKQEAVLGSKRRSRRASLEAFQGLVASFEELVQGTDQAPGAAAA